ncbi:MAG: hypothetical protein ACR2J9_10315 [Gaiellales bacterium]
MDHTAHDPTTTISRSGLILGAAGLVGATALAGLPGSAAAAVSQPTHELLHAPTELRPHAAHGAYNRRHFDRANAAVVMRSGEREMHLRVEDLVSLPHAEGAAHGSDAWAGAFSVLLRRTGGAQLDSGTFATTVNGRTFPLHISRVGPNAYQAIFNRFSPKGA